MIVLILVGLFIAFLITSEKVFERTNYYKKYYSATDKIEKTNRLDFVNTGSTFAYYGLDYNSVGVNGLNLAFSPQSLELDFKLLKHFENRYNPGVTIFIVISDLAFAKKKYADPKMIEKYYKILNLKEIDNYNLLKAIRAKYFPVLYNWKNFLRFHWDISPDKELELSVNENDREAVEADAYRRCKSWIDEFGLKDLKDGRQSVKFTGEFSYTIGIVKDMIEWCSERGYKPIIVNLPVAKEMKNFFSQEFLDAFYYDCLKKAIGNNEANVKFIDFQKDERLSDYLLFLDSCRLNKAGREIITRLLLKEINN